MAQLTGVEAYRRIVTRVILAVLALAVAASLLGIFAGPSLDAGRFWGAVFLSFACSLGLFLSSRALSSPKSQRAGMFTVIVVLVCYAIGLTAIWAPPGRSFWASSEHLGPASLFLLLVGVVGAFMFQILADRAHRLAGIAGLIMCAVSLLFLECYAFTAGWNDDSLMAFGMMALGASLLLAACLAGAGRARHTWRWIGVLATVIAYAATVFLWSRLTDYGPRSYIYGSRFVHRTPGSVLFDRALLSALWEIAGIVAIANLLWLADLTSHQAMILRWPTLVFATIGAAMATAVIAFDDSTAVGDPFLTEVMGACCVLTLAGLLATQVLSNMRRKPQDAVKQYDVTHLLIVCPYCKEQRSIAAGAGTCSACGMQFVVQVREPHCPQCEYSLLMNRSGRCPECGWVIPSDFGASSAPHAPAPAAPTIATPPPIPPPIPSPAAQLIT